MSAKWFGSAAVLLLAAVCGCEERAHAWRDVPPVPEPPAVRSVSAPKPVQPHQPGPFEGLQVRRSFDVKPQRGPDLVQPHHQQPAPANAFDPKAAADQRRSLSLQEAAAQKLLDDSK